MECDAQVDRTFTKLDINEATSEQVSDMESATMATFSCQPFEPRPIRFLGVESAAGFQVKTYSIVFGGVELDRPRFDDAWRQWTAALPQPAVAAGRPGVAFVIMHQGRTGDYLVGGWWDRENELPLRIFIRDGADWRLAQGSESVCVWDLKVIWWEREAYVGTIMSGSADAVDRYLATVIDGWA